MNLSSISSTSTAASCARRAPFCSNRASFPRRSARAGPSATCRHSRLYLFVSLIFFLILSTANIAILQLSLNVEQTSYSTDGKGHVYLTHNGNRQLMPNFWADARKRVHVKTEDTDVVLPNVVADGSLTNNVAPHVVRFFAPIGTPTRMSRPRSQRPSKISTGRTPLTGTERKPTAFASPVIENPAQAGARSGRAQHAAHDVAAARPVPALAALCPAAGAVPLSAARFISWSTIWYSRSASILSSLSRSSSRWGLRNSSPADGSAG